MLFEFVDAYDRIGKNRSNPPQQRETIKCDCDVMGYKVPGRPPGSVHR